MTFWTYRCSLKHTNINQRPHLRFGYKVAFFLGHKVSNTSFKISINYKTELQFEIVKISLECSYLDF